MNRGAFITAAGLSVAGVVGVKAAAAALRVRVGDTLHSDTGSWLGNPSRYSYKWQSHTRASPVYVTIQNGAAADYVIVPIDAGHEIRVQVTAYNPAASTPAASQPTGTIRR